MNNLHMSETSSKKARAARDSGMARALEHAERACEGWRIGAEASLITFARFNRAFTSFDFRQRMREEGRTMPPTDKAFGPVFLRAANRGLIEKIGYTQHPERHCSPTPVWRSLVYAGDKT